MSVILRAHTLNATLRGKRFATKTLGILHKKYPGYHWLVGIDFEGGILNIQCAEFAKYTNHGYTEHIARWTPQRIMRAGGNILEHWGVSRTGRRVSELVDFHRRPFHQRVPRLD